LRRAARSCVLGLAVAALALLAAAPAFAGSPEIEFVDGAPVPPDVRPVIICSGSDYDMGYQYFNQLITVHGWEWWLGEYVGKSFTPEQIKALKARQWTLLHEIPWAIEFMKGSAAAATDAGVEMTYAEVLAYYTGLRTFPGMEPDGSQDLDLPPSEGTCSGFAAWGKETRDRSLIVGANGDHQMYDPAGFGSGSFGPDFVAMFYPEDGHKFMFSQLLHHILHPAMNVKGVCYVHHAGGSGGNGPIPGYGVPSEFRTWNALRYTEDAVTAKDMVVGLGGKGIWADIHGNAFAIECTNPLAIREPGHAGEKNFIYAANNTIHRDLRDFQEPDPEMGLYYVPHAGFLGATYDYYDPDSVARNLSMWNMLHNYRGKVDLEFAKMMYRFKGPAPKAPLEELAETYDTSLGKGMNTPIGSTENAGVVVCRPDDGDEGVYYVSNGCVTRGGQPHWPDGHFYYPQQLYTFYKLTLAESPDDAIWASRNSAHYALYYADQQLRKLTYKNAAYAPLSALFDQAVKAWLSAQWEYSLSGRTQGNDAVSHQNKALRAFTKCEAYANHVYEALVPPAKTPQELGLRKWGGKWGKWATRGYPWDSNKKKDRVAEVLVPPTK